MRMRVSFSGGGGEIRGNPARRRAGPASRRADDDGMPGRVGARGRAPGLGAGGDVEGGAIARDRPVRLVLGVLGGGRERSAPSATDGHVLGGGVVTSGAAIVRSQLGVENAVEPGGASPACGGHEAASLPL